MNPCKFNQIELCRLIYSHFDRQLMNYTKLKKWLRNLEWTPESALKWQEFYNNASRYVIYGTDGRQVEILPRLPKYEDLEPTQCNKQQIGTNNSVPMVTVCN